MEGNCVITRNIDVIVLAGCQKPCAFGYNTYDKDHELPPTEMYFFGREASVDLMRMIYYIYQQKAVCAVVFFNLAVFFKFGFSTWRFFQVITRILVLFALLCLLIRLLTSKGNEL